MQIFVVKEFSSKVMILWNVHFTIEFVWKWWKAQTQKNLFSSFLRVSTCFSVWRAVYTYRLVAYDALWITYSHRFIYMARQLKYLYTVYSSRLSCLHVSLKQFFFLVFATELNTKRTENSDKVNETKREEHFCAEKKKKYPKIKTK